METVRPTCNVNSKKTSIHTSVIVNRGKILVATTNRVGHRCRKTRTGPRYNVRHTYPACTIHAEMMAIKLLGDMSKLRGSEMYVWRLSPSKQSPLNSEPCQECKCVLEKCMREYGLRRVYYSIDTRDHDMV
jgi:hypothetical protein